MSVGIIAGNAASINIIQATLDVPEISANTSESNDLTVNGLNPGDVVLVVPQTFTAGLSYEATRVSAADTLPVRAMNSTASPINPASMVYTLIVYRPEGLGTTLPEEIAT